MWMASALFRIVAEHMGWEELKRAGTRKRNWLVCPDSLQLSVYYIKPRNERSGTLSAIITLGGIRSCSRKSWPEMRSANTRLTTHWHRPEAPDLNLTLLGRLSRRRNLPP